MSDVLAWHFLNDEGQLRTGEKPPPDGKWLKFPDEPRMCSCGLHASRKILHALDYAPGSWLCRVRCADVTDEAYDKLVCRRRKILWRVKADALLRAFARWCALQVEDQWNPPAIVKRFLRTGEEREAAGAAAWAIVGSAAIGAAGAAAWAAARSASGSVARAASNAAIGAALRAAAKDVLVELEYQHNRALVEFACEARRGFEKWEFTDV